MPHTARAVPPDAFDIRFYDERVDGVFTRRLWFRSLYALPDDPIVHECVLSFISDLYFFEPIVAQHGFRGNDRRIRFATTDHAMWFHHIPRTDEWLVLESSSPVAGGGRGLVTGEIRTLDGRAVATVVQEVAVRMAPAPSR
ncbi:hypothetical protein AU186_21605 [Mycobacterium sp. GA-1999]|nr:hypothetical protein AU185_04955 [Mycobacterium sp. GA-0227b]KUH84459.1 hypothetical protein AU186_21605 [Mycobacterium sp. GA-1999]KUH89405.1 hypothetical protein AU187_09820 [Mycobacterium sp. IS-1556]